MNQDASAAPTDEARDIAALIPEIRMPVALTLAGLAGGGALGLLAPAAPLPWWFEFALAFGDLWLRALQMTIIPLVAGLLVIGVVQTVEAARGGAMARRTLGMILGFLAACTLLAILMVPALLAAFPIPPAAVGALAGEASTAAAPVPSAADFVRALLPANVLDAAAKDAILPTIAFIALLAVAMTRLPSAPRKLLFDLFAGITGAMLVIIGWVLRLAPIGVFLLAMAFTARTGAVAIGALAHYVLIVTSVGTVVLLAAYLVATFGARLSPLRFARTVLPAQAMALSTQSSLACLPAMLAACRKLGVRPTSAEFVLPLAVALYRATSPGMNMAVAIYVAHLTGVELTPATLAAGFAVAMLTTIGSVSLPGAISFISAIGPICLAMGVPVGPLGLLVAIEMLPDLMRTLGNVTMDVAFAATVDRRSGSD